MIMREIILIDDYQHRKIFYWLKTDSLCFKHRNNWQKYKRDVKNVYVDEGDIKSLKII